MITNGHNVFCRCLKQINQTNKHYWIAFYIDLYYLMRNYGDLTVFLNRCTAAMSRQPCNSGQFWGHVLTIQFHLLRLTSWLIGYIFVSWLSSVILTIYLARIFVWLSLNTGIGRSPIWFRYFTFEQKKIEKREKQFVCQPVGNSDVCFGRCHIDVSIS